MKNFCECESSNCNHERSCSSVHNLREMDVAGAVQTLCDHCQRTAQKYLEVMDDLPAVFASEDFDNDMAKVTYPCWVNVCCYDRAFGGPEEGGWWYDTHDRITSEHVAGVEALNRIITYLRGRYSNKGLPPVSSVLSKGRFEIHVTKNPMADHLPKIKPHYE